MKFIILEAPAVCRRCRKYLRRGRGAFWAYGRVLCLRCARKKGDAPIDAEEQQLIDEEVDE